MDSQASVTVVVDEAELPEQIHEVTDPRSSCPHHRGEGFLAHSGNNRLQRRFPADVSEQQEKASQSPLAVVEKVIQEVLFDPNVTRE